jgi:hypothetical protein
MRAPEMSINEARTLVGERGYLRSYLDLAADTSGGPPLYHVMGGLCSLSGALCYGKPAYCRILDPLLSLFPHLYCCLIGPTGIGKTRSTRVRDYILSKAIPGA